MEDVLTVFEPTMLVKGNLEGDPALRCVRVRGELSNYKIHTSGHAYFTLKDKFSALRCVMFRSRRAYLSLLCQDGDAVVATGAIGVFERDGLYQLYVERLELDGLGALKEEFDRLRARLESEGLFDPARKRRLPLLPRRVGVVTSPTGAALRDIISVGRRRYPNCHLMVAPVLVQGVGAPTEIARAIQTLNYVSGIDVIIVGRGGGSQEELAAFNTEEVARAIFASSVPVISAVGHETDTTIADLVADARAPTPSAAAGMALPEKSELSRWIQGLAHRLEKALTKRKSLFRSRWEALTQRPALSRPLGRIDQLKQQVDGLSARLDRAFGHVLERKKAVLREMGVRLDALSPLATLSRGYSLCLKMPHRTVVKTISHVQPGDDMCIVLMDGEICCMARSCIPRSRGE